MQIAGKYRKRGEFMLFANLTDEQLIFVAVVMYGILVIGFVVTIISKFRDRRRR